MEAKLQEAIDIIENAGGFVMFPETSEEEKEIRQRTFDMEREWDATQEQYRLNDAKEALDSRNDYLQRKKEAFKEMNRAFYKPEFPQMLPTFGQLEDILLENGLDMDEMEDWIESQI